MGECMATTIITRDALTVSDRAEAEGDDLWLPVEELHAATGWELQPEGLCRGAVCVPVYGESMGLLSERDGAERLNFAGFARYLGQPYAHDAGRAAWYFGDGASDQQQRLQLLSAPDFELQDLRGGTHRLSDSLGKKVLLALWASW